MGSSTVIAEPQAASVTLGVILLLELNHSIAASYLTTTNQVPFLEAALVSGAVDHAAQPLAGPSLGNLGVDPGSGGRASRCTTIGNGAYKQRRILAPVGKETVVLAGSRKLSANAGH